MDPKEFLQREIDSYIADQTQFMLLEEELAKSVTEPRVGVKTTEGYACSTMAEPNGSRDFDPNNSLKDLGPWNNCQGLVDSEDEDESELPLAQFRKSLLDPS